MSNYCACSGGDEEYTIELNQQGPEGPQGPVGPEGFSPSISVKTSTDRAYILTVVNKEETFDTPNLYGELEKLNADLSNIPNPAFINGVSLSSIEDNIPMITMDSSRITTDVNGNLILNATASNEESMEVSNYEVVVNPKDQRLELHDNEGNVKIVATTDQQANVDIATTEVAGIVKPDGSTITVSNDGTISAVQQDLSNLATKDELASTNATVTNLQTSVASNTTSIGTLREDLSNLETTVGNNSADIAALDSDKLASSNIIAGANITIDRNGNNLTINSIGGGGGGSSINDSTISTASTWSSSKINSEITTVANTKNDNIFDISKFTVVGNPTITDDGIASGFSGARNYIKTTISAVDLKNKSWDITSKWIDTGTIITGTYDWFTLIGFHTPIDTSHGQVFFYKAIKTIKFFARFGNTNEYINAFPAITYTFTDLPSKFIIKLGFNYLTGKYTLYVNIGDGFYEAGSYTPTITEKQIYAIATESTGNIYIGGTPPNINADSIDLNAFKIYVDSEQVFNGLMESTKPIYDKINTTNTTLSTFQTDTDNNFSAVNSALNEKANLSDLAGYVTVNKYNELLARVVALETEINGGNA